MKTKFNLFGDRVLVAKEVTKQGSIIIPQGAGQDMHRLGRVVSTGSGKRPGAKDVEMYVKEGDLVWFQTNAIMQSHQMYELEGEILMNLMQSEIIARVGSNEITYDNFDVLGEWVLVKPFLKQPPKAKILLPEAAKQAMAIYFRVEKMGHQVDLPIKKGDEVVLVHGRAQPFAIQREDYAYVHKSFVHGVVEESRIVT